MIYALLSWGLTGVAAAYTWWCYRTGEISTNILTARRDEQPTTFNICLAMAVVICLLFAALALKETLAALA